MHMTPRMCLNPHHGIRPHVVLFADDFFVHATRREVEEELRFTLTHVHQMSHGSSAHTRGVRTPGHEVDTSRGHVLARRPCDVNTTTAPHVDLSASTASRRLPHSTARTH